MKIENLEENETIFFLNTSQLFWLIRPDVDSRTIIKTLIRVMDTPAEDVFHHYIVQKLPPMICRRVYGIK